jgi:hypothetical protein
VSHPYQDVVQGPVGLGTPWTIGILVVKRDNVQDLAVLDSAHANP